MPTSVVALDTTQYVRINTDIGAFILQAHRDTVRIAFSVAKPVVGNTAFHQLKGDDEPLIVPFTEDNIWALAMTDRSSLTVTEQRFPAEISNRDSLSLAVTNQDQTTQPIDIWFTEDKGSATSLLPVTQGDFTVTWEPGHNIAIGDVIEARTAENYVQTEVIDQVGDVSTVNIPFSRDFPIGVTVDVGNPNLNVLGSTGAIRVFRIAPSTLQKIDITQIIFSLEDELAMDFSKFGSLAPLTIGCALRYLNGDGTFTNQFNWRTNGELIERAFLHIFESKTGGGLHGFVAQSKWAGQDNRGVTIRLDGSLGEELEILVMDPLQTLSKFKAIAQGHVVQE